MSSDLDRSDLTSLFVYLIDICAVHDSAHVDEQASIGQIVFSLFDQKLQVTPSFYKFLNPLASPVKATKKRGGKDAAKGKKKGKSNPSKSPRRKPRTSISVDSPTPATPTPTSPRPSTAPKKASNPAVVLQSERPIVTQDEVIEKLLNAIEHSQDPFATTALARLLKGYAFACKDLIGQRRLRRLVRLDAVNHCLRALRPLLQGGCPTMLHVMAVDSLCAAIVHVAAKDRKITLKVRLAGLISCLARVICEAPLASTTPTLLWFICRCCLRSSVRNARAIGREKHFAENMVAVISTYNNLEIQAVKEAEAYASGQVSSMSYESAAQQPPFNDDATVNEWSAAEQASKKMVNLVEIVFLMSKNRKNKSQFLDKGVLPVFVKVFDSHLEKRYSHPIFVEILIAVVACIRQFVKFKKGKDQFLGLGGLSLCEKAIRDINEDCKNLARFKQFFINLLVQLQDTLCALCMICLPPTPFPMPAQPFPLSFTLPSGAQTTSEGGQGGPGASSGGGGGLGASSSTTAVTPRVRRTSTSTLLSRSLRNSFSKTVAADVQKTRRKANSTSISANNNNNDSALDEEGSASSDDDGGDEEDESFLFLGAGGSRSLMPGSSRGEEYDIDMLTPASEDDVDSDVTPDISAAAQRRRASQRIMTRANAEAVATTSKDGNSADFVMTYQVQKLTSLTTNYDAMFTECEHGACTSDMSPKHRRLTPPDSRVAKSFTDISLEQANKTLSVGTFVKVAFPDLYESEIHLQQQDLLSNPESMREAMIQEMARFRLENEFPPKVVYSLDALIANGPGQHNLRSPGGPKPVLENNDLEVIGKLDETISHLKFESRFECGNLRRATQVAERQYELILSPDINQRTAHYQWFYFEVSNVQTGAPYTFEIINCLKNTSMFSHGMQPVVYSVTEAKKGRPGWVRAGTSVCYYRNLYIARADSSTDDSDPVVQDKPLKKSTVAAAKAKRTQQQQQQQQRQSESGESDVREGKNYFSTRFSMKFRHTGDVVYIAYHYPYSFTYLQATLERIITHTEKSVYLRIDRLATTLRGNPLPLLTLTNYGTAKEIAEREIVVYSARVHPGEANSSWIMHGLIQYLTSQSRDANKLRERYVFKIIPMLNPDGVINGSHRCSLAGIDLNRVWDRPNPILHPTIFHAKGIIQYCCDVLRKKPFVFVDLHGHSRKPNVFMFGNNPEESWLKSDHAKPNPHYLSMPECLASFAKAFSLKECRFNITKGKESSARVALWRQFGLERAYTMESTYCGFDTGSYAGKQIGIKELVEMGNDLVQALLRSNKTSTDADSDDIPVAYGNGPVDRERITPVLHPRRRSIGAVPLAATNNNSGNTRQLRRSQTFKSTNSLSTLK